MKFTYTKLIKYNYYDYLQDVPGWLSVIRLTSFHSLARHPLGSGVLSRVCSGTLAVRMRITDVVVCFTGVCAKPFTGVCAKPFLSPVLVCPLSPAPGDPAS